MTPKSYDPWHLLYTVYGIFGRELTKYTVIYGVYIRFWPTLLIHPPSSFAFAGRLARQRRKGTYTHTCAHTHIHSRLTRQRRKDAHTHTHTHSRARARTRVERTHTLTLALTYTAGWHGKGGKARPYTCTPTNLFVCVSHSTLHLFLCTETSEIGSACVVTHRSLHPFPYWKFWKSTDSPNRVFLK